MSGGRQAAAGHAVVHVEDWQALTAGEQRVFVRGERV
jgi:hypothetical protein